MIGLEQILDFAGRLAGEFRPERIVLFGSYAYGRPREGSDVDLLVVLPFRGNAFDRATQMLRRVPPPFSVDLLVRSPRDTARRYRQFDPLIREALDRGRVLYERNSKGVAGQGRRRSGQRSTRVSRAKGAQLR